MRRLCYISLKIKIKILVSFYVDNIRRDTDNLVKNEFWVTVYEECF
jgi:Holliday junction resolvase RusA-like endonuclease